ncbi:MAG TPA: hypothetical protein VN829_23465 [Dongiaceae bacterium]|nr:hypothetical protein [Dongiaceae bacterium]
MKTNAKERMKDMKTEFVHRSLVVRKLAPQAVHPTALGILAVALFAGCCSTGEGAEIARSRSPAFDLAQLEPGAIAVTSPLKPARFSFQAAKGRVESAAEGAANAVRRVLTTPNLETGVGTVDASSGISIVAAMEAGLGAVECVLAPFAAGYGALSSAAQKLPPDKLSEAERELTEAMGTMADQRHLREALLQGAGDKTHRHLISLEPGAPIPSGRGPVSARLDTQVEELRLERNGAGDSKYGLRITARARLVRASDGAILQDRPYEYRSGQAMFIDWTRHDGLASVARTGYRQIADDIAKELFSTAAGKPILLGAGHKGSLHTANAPGLGLGPEASLARMAHVASAPPAPMTALDTQEPPEIRFVDYRAAEQGSMAIYLENPAPNLLLQTGGAEASDATSGTEWTMDGLENDANPVVQAVACVAAVPLGLWEQTVGAVRRGSGKRLEEVSSRLQQALQQVQPQRALAEELGRRLAPLTPKPVVVVRDPSEAWTKLEGIAQGGAVAGAGADTGLEIRVTDVRLARKQGFHARFALCLDAQATLLRLGDGQELYSCPLQYRSEQRRFADWTANDAGLFRQELGQCCREMDGALADELRLRGFVSPSAGSSFVAASR